MSGAEQTFNLVGGLEYGTGTRAKGSADTDDLAAAYGDPGLTSVYGNTKTAEYDTFESKVLQALLDSESSTFGEGSNSQTGTVDLQFGLQLSTGENIPPTITATTITGNGGLEGDLDGDGGNPMGGMMPSVSSPGEGSTSPGTMPGIPGYAESLTLHGNGTNGSNQSPGGVMIGSADDLLHHLKGFRPARSSDDASNGAE